MYPSQVPVMRVKEHNNMTQAPLPCVPEVVDNGSRHLLSDLSEISAMHLQENHLLAVQGQFVPLRPAVVVLVLLFWCCCFGRLFVCPPNLLPACFQFAFCCCLSHFLNCFSFSFFNCFVWFVVKRFSSRIFSLQFTVQCVCNKLVIMRTVTDLLLRKEQ